MSGQVQVSAKSPRAALGAAWLAWLETEEARRCRTPLTESDQERFLENRLFWAFMAGAKAGEEIAARAAE